MSVPEPLTVNVPFEDEAEPVKPTLPTSWLVHPAGNDESVFAFATLE